MASGAPGTTSRTGVRSRATRSRPEVASTAEIERTAGRMRCSSFSLAIRCIRSSLAVASRVSRLARARARAGSSEASPGSGIRGEIATTRRTAEGSLAAQASATVPPRPHPTTTNGAPSKALLAVANTAAAWSSSV